jgi:hypothetical protein
MSHKTKEIQLSFREEKEIVEEIQRLADLEGLSNADFVRKVFRHGLWRYRAAGSVFALMYEERKGTLDRQTETAKGVAKGARKKAS